MPYTLSFGWSSSPHYPHAVTLARSVSGSVTAGTGRTARHTVPIDLREPATAELLGLTLGWRGAQLAWEGHPLPRAQSQFVLWVVDCYQGRAVSMLGAEYCWDWGRAGEQPVPCRCLAPQAARLVRAASGDRTQLRRQVEAAARLRGLHACPVFDLDAVVAALAPAIPAAPLGTADAAWLADLLRRLDDPEIAEG